MIRTIIKRTRWGLNRVENRSLERNDNMRNIGKNATPGLRFNNDTDKNYESRDKVWRGRSDNENQRPTGKQMITMKNDQPHDE